MKKTILLAFISLLLIGCENSTPSDASPSTSAPTSESTSTPIPEYVVDFDLNGGTSSSYHGPVTITSFDESIFFFDCIKEGWSFRGWSYNEVKVLDENGNLLSMPSIDVNMTFVAVYSQTAIMTITTNLAEAGTINGQGEYAYNTYVDVSAHPNQGYEFVGWYYQNTLLSNTEDYKYMMWSEDVTLEARFKLASFLMNIHTNNNDYGLVLLRSSLNNNYLPEYQEYRDYTTQVTIAAYSKTDVRFLGWYDSNNSLIETNAVYTFTMPNYDYTLEAKWNYFTVSYNLYGGTNDLSNPTSYTTDSVSLVLHEPIKTGYDFLGWKYNNNYVTEINPSWVKDIELNAVWRAHDYSITYNLNGGTNDSSNPDSYSINSETITLEQPTRYGYTFGGWYRNSDFTNEITQIIKGSYGDLIIYAKWTPISYSISYNLDGGTNSPNNPSTYTIESSLTLDAPTKTGFTFLGWFTNDSDKVISIVASTTGALSLTARWAYDGELLTLQSNKTVMYGIYPQTNVDNASLVSALNTITTPASNGWYFYDGNYYAKTETTLISDDNQTFDNGKTIENGSIYWFKCEPIIWNVLNNNNDEYYVVSSVLLDAHYYGSISPHYDRSSIRTWLNNDFYNTAFSLDNNYVKTTMIDNSASTTDEYNGGSPYSYVDTQDKVFLPSYQDYLNPAYGFSSSLGATHTRCCKTTDWARARGASFNATNGNGIYYTRSVSRKDSTEVWCIRPDGSFVHTRPDSDGCDGSVRPAITIKI